MSTFFYLCETKNWGSMRWGYTYLDREQPVLRPQGRRTTQSFPPKQHCSPWFPNWGVYNICHVFEKSISENTFIQHEVSFIPDHDFFQKLIIHDPRRNCKLITSRIPSTRIVGERMLRKLVVVFHAPHWVERLSVFSPTPNKEGLGVFSATPTKNGGRWCSHPKMGAVFRKMMLDFLSTYRMIFRFLCESFGANSILGNPLVTVAWQPNLHAKAVIVCSFSLWFLNRLLKFF